MLQNVAKLAAVVLMFLMMFNDDYDDDYEDNREQATTRTAKGQ